jgi:hypothetical protein
VVNSVLVNNINMYQTSWFAEEWIRLTQACNWYHSPSFSEKSISLPSVSSSDALLRPYSFWHISSSCKTGAVLASPRWCGCPGLMGLDGNEIADQLGKHSSSHPLTMPEPVPGMSVKVVREVIRGWMRRETWGVLAFHLGRNASLGFSEKIFCCKSWGVTQLKQKPAENNYGLLTGCCHLKGCQFNPLPVQFKSLLPGQEGCIFFQWAFKCM